MIGIKDGFIYVVVLEENKERLRFNTVFLKEECNEYTDKENLMVVLDGFNINCYGKDIKKAKELLIESYERNLKRLNNMINDLKVKEININKE